MLDPVRRKLKLIGITAGAFTGGVLLASGLDWTTGSHAATLQTTTQPPTQQTRPVAELSQAFISIAESVTPAVVAVETERAPRAAERPGSRNQPDPDERGREFYFPFPLPDEQPRIPR